MSVPFNFRPRSCEHCGEGYEPRSRTQRFCARCAEVATTCEVCGQEARRSRALHERKPRRFCSRKCKWAASGGLQFNQGRWWVVCRDGTKMQYARALLANEIGRLLSRDEDAHHVNEIKTDDRVENLRVLSRSEHLKLHNPKGRKIGAKR